jgi:thioredoxin-dependent peroxiredoxin
MLPIGSDAPNFKLPDHEGVVHRLADYSGSWVLVYFYPKDDTPGCTKEACTLRDNAMDYEAHNITVLGISADSEMSHQKFISKYNLPFTLLSDPDKKVIDMYGAKNEMGGTKRISYLIGPEGIIEKTYADVKPEMHAEEVLNDVKELA